MRSFFLLVVLVVTTTEVYSQGQYIWKNWQGTSMGLWEAIYMQWSIAYAIIIPCVVLIIIALIMEYFIQKIGDSEQQKTNRILLAIAKHLGVKEEEYAEPKRKSKRK